MRHILLKRIFLKENSDDNLKILKNILSNSDEDFVDEIYDIVKKRFKNKKTKDNIEENIIEKRNEILKTISNIDDEKEIESILSFINRKFILKAIRYHIENKIGSLGNKIDELITDMILKLPTSFNSKMEFALYLKNNGYLFDGKEILNNKRGNLYSLVTIRNDAYELIKRQIAKLDGSLGFRQIQGPGEFFLMFFGKDINISKHSDVNIAGFEIEVKASRKSKNGRITGGRFSGTSFYANMSSVKLIFFDSLRKAGISDEDLKIYENSLNLNFKGLNNLNNLIKKYSLTYNDIFNIFLITFKNIMFKFSENDIKKYVGRFIRANGIIDANEFIKTAALISFEYYKMIEGFDAILLINVDSGNYVVIEDAEDLEANFNIIKLENVPPWSEGRKPSISPQITIK